MSARSFGVYSADVDPMAAVLDFGGRADGIGWLTGWMFAALVLQGMLALALAAVSIGNVLDWAQGLRAKVREKLTQEYEIVVEKPEEPPPPPPPEPEKAAEPPPPPTAAPPPPQAAKQTPAPAPQAAQAGAALTAKEDPNEPVDLTNTIVTGNAASYAGGSTMANGTSATAVNAQNVQPNGAPGGTGTANSPAPKVDRSRRASTMSQNWNCPFPPESDVAQVDEAVVPLEISVRADGTAEKVRVLKDPGYGFGRAASGCAMRSRYNPALDADGNPIPMTIRVNMNFSR